MERKSCCSGSYNVRKTCEPSPKAEPKKEEVLKPKIEKKAAQAIVNVVAPKFEVEVKKEEPSRLMLPNRYMLKRPI
ncbi:hypothetical protein CRG98_041880 [Punica granatum]|uniref:Uncharacterized protein n=1 Tax=Punica granatum TaxID=22663 RepID=A0A2I0I171_PUNGR|nr:hypothetical protein CRG98_041880 [Punica granatum]